MDALGYRDGKNVQFLMRYHGENIEKAEHYAGEPVASNVGLICCTNTTSASAARKATTSIPIVFALVSDSVVSGIVRSLSRPGTKPT